MSKQSGGKPPHSKKREARDVQLVGGR
jgi:hypothetical protein